MSVGPALSTFTWIFLPFSWLSRRIHPETRKSLHRSNQRLHEDRSAIVEQRQHLVNRKQRAAHVEAEDPIECCSVISSSLAALSLPALANRTSTRHSRYIETLRARSEFRMDRPSSNFICGLAVIRERSGSLHRWSDSPSAPLISSPQSCNMH